jgi:hypothetical protein
VRIRSAPPSIATPAEFFRMHVSVRGTFYAQATRVICFSCTRDDSGISENSILSAHYRKSVDQVLALLQVLNCDVELVVRSKTA